MDEFTRWDDGISGPGTYTAWDDVPGGPGETFWDLLPSVISRGFEIVWNSLETGVSWLGLKTGVRW